MASKGSDMIKLPKYVTERDGRLYFRRTRKVNGKQKTLPMTRLPDLSDPAFSTRYQELLQDRPAVRILAGSMDELISLYRASPEFKKLATSTRKNSQIYFDIIGAEYSDYAYASLHRAKVYELRDQHQETPGKANNLITTLSTLYAWAVKRGMLETNPCTGVERLPTGEYQPWPDDVLNDMREAATPMLRLAINVLYYTGQRIGDVCRMQWNHIEDGYLHVTQEKTGTSVEIPLHSELVAALGTVPRESVFLLYGRYKQPFTPDALRERLRVLRNRLDVDCKFHGLRKNAVNALLEAGASEYQVGAITGQTPQTIAHYAKRVNKRTLASAAILKWEKKNG